MKKQLKMDAGLFNGHPHQAAAFFYMEGVLTSCTTFETAMWLTAHAKGMGERASRLGHAAMWLPFRLAGGMTSGSFATRAMWRGLRGLPKERLLTLTDMFYKQHLFPQIRDEARALAAQATKEERRIIVLSDQIDLLARPVANEIGADDLLCNRLQVRRGEATGLLETPIITKAFATEWVRLFARRHKVDFKNARGFGSNIDDCTLLHALNNPCAVHPDRMLRRVAKARQWPVIG